MLDENVKQESNLKSNLASKNYRLKMVSFPAELIYRSD